MQRRGMPPVSTIRRVGMPSVDALAEFCASRPSPAPVFCPISHSGPRRHQRRLRRWPAAPLARHGEHAAPDAQGSKAHGAAHQVRSRVWACRGAHHVAPADCLLPHASCWSLGRYIKWILERAEGGHRSELDAVVASIMERCLDHNRRVQVWVPCASPQRGRCCSRCWGADLQDAPCFQVAACGAVATIVEEAGSRSAPYLPSILSTLATALQQYSRQALRSAYDTVVAVAEVCGRPWVL